MMGAVFTEKEIRELIARMERAERLRRDNGSRTADAFAECAAMLKDLLEEHGL